MDLETKKYIYCNIKNGTHGIWRDIEYDGVQRGDGKGGVWVHKRRPARDFYAWEVLKMNKRRLEDLHVRNVPRVKARQKPVKLPFFFEKLLQDRDLERLAKMKQRRQSIQIMQRRNELSLL